MRIATIALAITAALLTAKPAPAQGPPPAPVRAEPATLRHIQPRRAVTGDIRAARRSLVASQEEGLVVELLIREGDRVQQGQLIARLDDRRLALSLQAVQAELAVAESLMQQRAAEATLWQDQLAFLENAIRRGAANEKERDDARTSLAAARAALAQAERQIPVIQARADLLATRLADTQIKAPFAGIIVQRATEVGQWLAAGQTVAQIVDTAHLEAWLTLDQELLPHAQAISSPILIKPATTDQPFPVSTVRVIPDVHPSARTFTLVAPFDAGDDALAPGISCTAWVPAGPPADHLTIPRDALLYNDLGPYVYAIRPTQQGDAAFPVPIDVLFETADRVAIRPGPIAPGDLVVTEGNERLFPSAPVSIITTDAPGSP